MSLDDLSGLIERDVRIVEATGDPELKDQTVEQLRVAGVFRVLHDLTIARYIDVMNGGRYSASPDVLPFPKPSQKIPVPPAKVA